MKIRDRERCSCLLWPKQSIAFNLVAAVPCAVLTILLSSGGAKARANLGPRAENYNGPASPIESPNREIGRIPGTSIQITEPDFLVAQNRGAIESDRLRDEVRDLVREEVDYVFGHTIALLNTFIFLLALFPTIAAAGVWILQGRLARKISLAEQEIESIKYDTISQLKVIVTEAREVLDNLRQQSNLADEQIEQLHAEGTLLQYSDAMPDDSQPLLMANDYAKQGDNFFIEGRYQEAIASYEKALKIHPEMADTWNNRGVVLTRLQKYEDAIASYDRALQIRPEYPDAWNNRGVCLLELQQYQEAIVSYEQAIKVKPDYADAWNNRGVALAKLQNYQEAVKSYNQALAIKNDYSDAWNNRGVSLTKLGIYGEAIACYDNATKLRPDFFSAWYNKARCYALQSRESEAIETFKKAMNLNPKYAREMAKQEADFESIRNAEEFQQLING